MNPKQIVDDMIKDKKEIAWRIHDMRSALWDLLTSIGARYYDAITTEREFLDVLSELLDRLLCIRTGVPVLDQVVEMVDGMIINSIVTRIDRLVLDRYFGKDWFVKLRASAHDLLTRTPAHAELIDESSVMELHNDHTA